MMTLGKLIKRVFGPSLVETGLYLDNSKAGVGCRDNQVSIMVEKWLGAVIEQYVDLGGRAFIRNNETSAYADVLRQVSTQYSSQHAFLPFSVCQPMVILDEMTDAILERLKFESDRAEVI
jgi:hypothetical protein